MAQKVKVDGKYYPSCAAACQDLGIEVGSDSAHRKLDKWARDNPGHIIEYIGAPKQGPQPPRPPVPPDRHEQLKQKMVEIGKKLGYYTSTEERGPVHQHDVLWKQSAYKRDPSHVIEICVGGALPKDFDALNWANENVGARGILVVVDEADYRKAIQRFENKPDIVVVKAETVDCLHELVMTDLEFLKLIFGEKS